jgi:alanine racemase
VRPTQVRINLAAFKNNLSVVRRYAPGAKVMAVIKADGYGHGLDLARRGLQEADGYAVMELESAIALRDAGARRPIFLLEGFFAQEEIPLLAEFGLTPVIHCIDQIEELAQTSLPVRLDVFVKINTGMNRLGIRPAQFTNALQALQAVPHVGRITLMSHFACADEVDGINEPLGRFNELANGLPLPRSLANSAALLADPRTHGDWVRPGIMLYGSSPFADRGFDEFGLQPVMTLESEIIAIQELRAGESTGYGAVFTTQQPKRVGIVACGYADGYPRHAPTGTPVLVNGKLTHTLGRVSMDMLAVDLSGTGSARLGSKVVLWGEGLPVDEVARAAGTISYELLCAVAPRVPVVEVE